MSGAIRVASESGKQLIPLEVIEPFEPTLVGFAFFDLEIPYAKKAIKEVHLRGGLELLCESVKIHNVDVTLKAEENKLTMKDLLSWVRTNLIKERPEMFMKGDTVRPGVLVLVNDCDWELSGQLETTLEEKDVIVFISTLHGG
ncbi:hypothetical protein IFM89_020637 [Coptis chinensis]|uniref:Ubiquitin-related modifier 1 homolog n=1 Tax=Coptis chinensis TaxID=261450 RepID=A0A835M065_9MAGN|nr:hypothetical protein IFM89_020637 [Coptis chinensis]